MKTTVVDPMGVAEGLRDDQRSVLTAFMLWLGDAGRARSIRVSFLADTASGCLVVEADLGDHPPAKREIDRFVALARAAAFGAEGRVTRENVQVRLTYEHGE